MDNYKYFIILIVSTKCILLIFGHNLNTECITFRKEIVNVGTKWYPKNACGMFKCTEITVSNFKLRKFAISVPYKCRVEMAEKPGCRILHSKQIKTFPECCPRFGCVKNSGLEIMSTNPDGFIQIYKIDNLPKSSEQEMIQLNQFYGSPTEMLVTKQSTTNQGFLLNVTKDLLVKIIDEKYYDVTLKATKATTEKLLGNDSNIYSEMNNQSILQTFPIIFSQSQTTPIRPLLDEFANITTNSIDSSETNNRTVLEIFEPLFSRLVLKATGTPPTFRESESIATDLSLISTMNDEVSDTTIAG